MVFNTKKGGGAEGEKKGGVHASTLVPSGPLNRHAKTKRIGSGGSGGGRCCNYEVMFLSKYRKKEVKRGQK